MQRNEKFQPYSKAKAYSRSAFNRKYGNGLFEAVNMDSAKHAVITMGTLSGTIKHILANKEIKDIGLISLRSYRPFPADELGKVLENVESVGVLEKDISLGLGGALYSELRFIRKPMAGFIGGLGGRDITVKEIMDIFDAVRKNKEGINWNGQPISKKILVRKKKIQALWFGIDIPSDISPGRYSGYITVSPKELPERKVMLVLDIQKEISEENDPYFIDIYLNIGVVYNERGDYDKSCE